MQAGLTIAQLVIPILVPILIRYTKQWVGTRTWMLPLVAGALGVVGDAAQAYALNGHVAPVTGLALGLAGVGVREAVDQLRKPATP